ncbi:response regulator [candidate division KSB1 bacterium]|nr:response regulator [candidate division KSB1 bacterium]
MAKVLIIDDIEFTRETIGKMLSRNGYEVIEASNGKDGIELYKQYAPDLVLTDILMPEMDGLETIQKLNQLSSSLPIIAITGSADSSFLEIALKFGAVTGLLKPFKQAELLSEVNKYVPV